MNLPSNPECWVAQILPVNKDPFDVQDCGGCSDGCLETSNHRCHLTGRIEQCIAFLPEGE